MLITICLLFGLIVFAQYIESYKIYVINKEGRLQPVDGVLHIDINDTSKSTKQRLSKKFNDYLRKPKPYQGTDFMDAPYREQKRSKNNYIDITHLINRSPVVYSNGRYTLDLDKIDVRDIQDTTNKPEAEQEYYDPEENFRDYYDYIGVNDRLRSDSKKQWENLKTISEYLKNNLRRYNRILRDVNEKPRYGRNSDANFGSQKKRFAIINNGGRKKKNQYETYRQNKQSQKKSDVSSETAEDEVNDNDVGLQDKSIESHESPEYDDGVYLQGNTLIKFNGQNSDTKNTDQNDNKSDDSSSSSGDETEDLRRRLPHFMPKSYHWDEKAVKNLGFFWFNGDRGKYPEARPL